MAAVAGNTQYRTNSCNNVNINRDRATAAVITQSDEQAPPLSLLPYIFIVSKNSNYSFY